MTRAVHHRGLRGADRARGRGRRRTPGLTGVLVTPGPDLAVPDRLRADRDHRAASRCSSCPRRREPAMIVPILERPDAEAAPGAPARCRCTTGPTADDPYAATAALLEPDGRYAISDSAWAMHLLGLQHDAARTSSYVSMTNALPMLRAVKDDDELERLAAAGAAADASLEEIVGVRVRRPHRDRDRRRPRRLPAQARALAGRLHGRRLGPERRQPAPRGGRPRHRGGRHGRARLRRPQGRLRLGHHAHRPRRRADRRGARGVRDRPPRAAGRLRGRPARASPARRSTAPRAR